MRQEDGLSEAITEEFAPSPSREKSRPTDERRRWNEDLSNADNEEFAPPQTGSRLDAEESGATGEPEPWCFLEGMDTSRIPVGTNGGAVLAHDRAAGVSRVKVDLEVFT